MRRPRPAKSVWVAFLAIALPAAAGLYRVGGWTSVLMVGALALLIPLCLVAFYWLKRDPEAEQAEIERIVHRRLTGQSDRD
jgi:hypothetical protein